MASFLFSDSSSCSKHNDYDNVTSVRKNQVFRKLFVNELNEIINVDSYDNVDR